MREKKRAALAITAAQYYKPHIRYQQIHDNDDCAVVETGNCQAIPVPKGEGRSQHNLIRQICGVGSPLVLSPEKRIYY
jgi:hypothetical protein